MEGIDSVIDPHNEVRKLQELVKKLERQNEVLRSKQGSVLEGHKPNAGLEQVNKNSHLNNDDLEAEDGLRQSVKDGVALDDFDDVDITKLSVEEDDSWLYASPKALTPQQSSEQLMSWVRQDFDHPSPDVESSRRSLISKLDEAARMKHSSSSPILGGTHPHGSRSAASLSRSAEESTPPGLPSRLGLQRKSGLNPPGSNRNIDTGTFTRPKRTTNGNPPFHGGGDQPQDILAVPNAEDIENLAKQQEESLRQSIAPSNRKGFRSKQGLVDGENARLSPSRFDVEGSYVLRHRGSLGSDHSTPPDSPQYNQHFQLNNSNDSRGVRLSHMSNLQHNRSHNSSDSSLERHSVNSDDMNLAPEANRGPNTRLQQPNYRSLATNGPKRGSALPSMGQSPQQGRGQSPQRTSGLPTPRRQIMRPSSATRSSLPMYRRTNVPSPKPTSQEQEENWRDGCF